MAWKPVLVGVDGSHEASQAAALGLTIAETAGTTCRLVHVAPDYLLALGMAETPGGIDLGYAAETHARALIAEALEGAVPPAVIAGVEVRIGRAPYELAQAGFACGAGLVVLGGKHHRGAGRLLTGTIPHLVRTSPLPILATHGTGENFRRVLCAVDTSAAAGPTIAEAEAFARLFGASLRVMHVVEPAPHLPTLGATLPEDERLRLVLKELHGVVWPLITLAGVETVVRRGRSAAAIVNEVKHWNADLVVVGSHGKSWVDRLLIGSTSERILQVLPCHTLVVPTPRPALGGAVRTSQSSARRPM